MIRSNAYALRKVITPVIKKTEKLSERVYYKRAPKNPITPYAVYSLQMDSTMFPAERWQMHIELYDQSDSSDQIDQIADQIINEFDCLNFPNDEILPTFYFEDRQNNEEKDKEIQVIDIWFEIQNYQNE